MIKYILRQNNNAASTAFGKFYAFPVTEETMDLNALAQHMQEHNSGFSKGMILGILTQMINCIKEQLLAGKNVKIDDLAIFSVGIRNKRGADSAETFTVSNNIEGVKLRARATGSLSNANLNLEASLKKATVLMGSTTVTDETPGGDEGGDETPETPSGGNSGSGSEGGNTGGSGNTGSGDSGNGGGGDSGSGNLGE